MNRFRGLGRSRTLSRRTVLRGLGAAVALPWLEAMMPWGDGAFADEAGAPVRLAFLFVPNGKHMADWTPTHEGREFPMPWILEPLARHRQELLVLSGLAQDQARAHGDGPGDHARSSAVFLTGAHPVKTDGRNIRVGVSADQLAAQQVGQDTRFASLALGCDASALAGNCDSGYSCAYSSNVSWRSPTTPASKEADPRVVFDRLFGDGRPGDTEATRGRRRRYEESVLDVVRGDAEQLTRRLGREDRAKVDEYLTGVREIERRIERAEDDRRRIAESGAVLESPAGIPQDYADHIRVLGDLMALAFQLDQTRVVSFMFANAGSNRTYPQVGVRERHHGLSHHGKDATKLAKIREINRFHVEQLAAILDRFRSVREGDGTLLDNTLLVYGSGIGDGNRHNHNELPVLLAGRGGGTVDPGRHLRYPKNTPLNNLFLAMLARAGCTQAPFGDATAPLPRIG